MSHRFCSRNDRRAKVGSCPDAVSENSESDWAFHDDRDDARRCYLTPELSRAERGRREPVLLVPRQVSTKPRYGVGLNDELGAKEAGEGEVIANGTKDRSPDA